MKTYWSSSPVSKLRLDVDDKHAIKSMTWDYKVEKDALKQYLLLANIVDDLKYLRDKREEDIFSRNRRYDWVQVARVFDRFLLAIFLIFNIVMVVGMFVIFPATKANRPSVYIPVSPDIRE